MSYPNEFWGQEGEQFNSYAAERYITGTLMKFKDGRMFRFGKNGATTGVAGNLYQSAAPVTNHVTQAVQAAVAALATSIPVTIGATAVAADEYKDGHIVVENADGQGYVYKIGSHALHAGAGTFTVPLLDNKVQVALTTSTEVSLFYNKYKGAVIHPSPPTTGLVGVMMKPLVASYWGWFQVRGLGAVLSDGAITAGLKAAASSSVNGSVSVWASGLIMVGNCVYDAGTTDYCTIDLDIE